MHSLFLNNPNGSTYDFVAEEASGDWSQTVSFGRNNLEPGDVIFYQNLDGDSVIDHVAMVVGDDPNGYPIIDAHTDPAYRVRYDFGAGGDNGITYYMDALWDSMTYP